MLLTHEGRRLLARRRPSWRFLLKNLLIIQPAGVPGAGCCRQDAGRCRRGGHYRRADRCRRNMAFAVPAQDDATCDLVVRLENARGAVYGNIVGNAVFVKTVS